VKYDESVHSLKVGIQTTATSGCENVCHVYGGGAVGPNFYPIHFNVPFHVKGNISVLLFSWENRLAIKKTSVSQSL
jgi:hypothetical protein